MQTPVMRRLRREKLGLRLAYSTGKETAPAKTTSPPSVTIDPDPSDEYTCALNNPYVGDPCPRMGKWKSPHPMACCYDGPSRVNSTPRTPKYTRYQTLRILQDQMRSSYADRDEAVPQDHGMVKRILDFFKRK